MPPVHPAVLLATLAGIGFGLWLLVRGFRGRIDASRIADTATSSIASIALGEVRVSGVVEAAELLLASPLQDVPCVYYRSRVDDRGSDWSGGDHSEERAVGFRVRDASGALRVFPHGGRWDVPDRFDESSSRLSGAPPGLRFRVGGAYRPADPDRDALVAELLTVREPGTLQDWTGGGVWAPGAEPQLRYREARVEPGDVVTILGRVIRFGDLPDPTGADVDAAVGGPMAALDDPAIAADIAAARAAGALETDPAEAWGNAAIPGFGIGQPISEPELHPEATPATLASVEQGDRFERTFDLSPGSLVLAADPDVPLIVSLGSPGEAADRHDDRFAVGLLGAILAIASAVVLALALSGIVVP